MQVTYALKQERTVVDGHHVARLETYHEVEVLHRPVVVAHLHTQLSAVVVGKEIVGLQLYRLVVVGKRPTQVVDVVAGKRTVHVVVGVCGLEMDCLGELLVGIAPL